MQCSLPPWFPCHFYVTCPNEFICFIREHQQNQYSSICKKKIILPSKQSWSLTYFILWIGRGFIQIGRDIWLIITLVPKVSFGWFQISSVKSFNHCNLKKGLFCLLSLGMYIDLSSSEQRKHVILQKCNTICLKKSF